MERSLPGGSSDMADAAVLMLASVMLAW